METKSKKSWKNHHACVKHASPLYVMGIVTLTSWTVEAAEVVVVVVVQVSSAVVAHNVSLRSAPAGAPDP